ncbi:ABC-three component system protein [Lactococcus formosensis]|uniref:ABC-three component system protein n=1 Tax=Lactococcus formosensis TaxID=1281486 RepID=UPI00254D3EC1|nr:ABC-three component system protein [Lactococcus formosensis]
MANRNATSSWSGYNHQGQVGIFLALHELQLLLKQENPYSDYSVQFEKEDGEDIDIINGNTVISRHQVKAKSKGKYPKDYENVMTVNSSSCPSGFNIDSVDENSRYLHTICPVFGFGLPRENFNFLIKHSRSPKPIFVENKSRIKLYQYPNGKNYCKLAQNHYSFIDQFCKDEIKTILNFKNHPLKSDDDHIEETLFDIKELLCKTISRAHSLGNGSFPKICFRELYNMICSTEKREKQSIHRAKVSMKIYWDNNLKEEDNIDENLFNAILNLPNDEFLQFLIDLHPQKAIQDLKSECQIDNLIDEVAFEEIFYDFFLNMNSEKFDIIGLKYKTRNFKWRLSLINNAPRNIDDVIGKIFNNSFLLTESYDTKYLINGRINEPIIKHLPIDQTGIDTIMPKYSTQPNIKESIFNSDLEFIDIQNTLEKIKED